MNTCNWIDRRSGGQIESGIKAWGPGRCREGGVWRHGERWLNE